MIGRHFQVLLTLSKPGAGDNPAAANATVQIVDLGTNIAGVCRFSFAGAHRPAGETVTIRYENIQKQQQKLPFF